MSSYSLIIIGGGLSGLAAGIRFARFGENVLILEKHSRIGGLNSYYYRKGFLLETGLHAITNFAPPDVKSAPINRLFRQLKISRQQVGFHEQFSSRIYFQDRPTLHFSNDFNLLKDEISRHFPESIDRFISFVSEIDRINAFVPGPHVSARKKILAALNNKLLTDMLLCPLLFYGSSEENDMDFNQFIIMFRSIYQEGFFRPDGTMKDFLQLLKQKYINFGGKIRLKTGVNNIISSSENKSFIQGVRLHSGEEITADFVLTTIGYPETLKLLNNNTSFKKNKIDSLKGKLTFTESIHILPAETKNKITSDQTIIFYNISDHFRYEKPAEAVDINSGVICFPENFKDLPEKDIFQLRVTHQANYDIWKQASINRESDEYVNMKDSWNQKSVKTVSKIIGNYQENVVYEDSFTPVTIEKYTGRAQGAIYGSACKLKDGKIRNEYGAYENLYIAGTDQGYLGIIGSMLSGVSIVNQHILGKV